MASDSENWAQGPDLSHDEAELTEGLKQINMDKSYVADWKPEEAFEESLKLVQSAQYFVACRPSIRVTRQGPYLFWH